MLSWHRHMTYHAGRNLDEFACVQKFRFDQKFETFTAEQFVRDFFTDPTVQGHLQVSARLQFTVSQSRCWTNATRCECHSLCSLCVSQIASKHGMVRGPGTPQAVR